MPSTDNFVPENGDVSELGVAPNALPITSSVYGIRGQLLKHRALETTTIIAVNSFRHPTAITLSALSPAQKTL